MTIEIEPTGVYTGLLHAYSYLKTSSGVTLSWELNDSAGPCGANLDDKFRMGSLTVTNLDKNGIDEIWLIYGISCHGYKTPSPMKVFMHEGAPKYAMRGTTKLKLKVTPARYIGDDYTFDEAFTTSPAVFKTYDKQL